jgi:hypothetical protein
MSKEYEGQDPLTIAQQAERDLNKNASDGKPSDSTEVSTISKDFYFQLLTMDARNPASTKPSRTNSQALK